MRLALATMMVAVTMTAAVEDSNDVMVKICGDDVVKALQEACEQKKVDYLLKHGLYEPKDELIQDHKHQHHDHPHHDHDHGHDHNHEHSHQHKDNHSHAEKKKNDRSILEQCCHKPCYVKDFISYCG